MDKRNARIFLLLAAIGAALAVIAALMVINQRAFIKSAKQTQAQVLELIPQYDEDDGSVTYAPRIRYTVNEKEYLHTSGFSSNPPSFSVGETINVYYDPQDPETVKINGALPLYLGSFVVGGIGAVFLLIGIIPTIVYTKRKKEIALLIQQGNHIKAKIIDITYNTSYTINNRHPYIIMAQALDPNTNKLELYKSDNLWSDPSPHAKKDQEITVHISPTDPKKYYMDTSFLSTPSP